MTAGNLILTILASYLALGGISAVFRFELIVAAVDDLLQEESVFKRADLSRNTWITVATFVHLLTWPFFFAGGDGDA